jgi:polyvinyl alcohol dehydrogenase (cytochrome)
MNRLRVASVLFGVALAATATAADHPGKVHYDKACAACHDHPAETRSPALTTLRGMRYGSIDYALTEGRMQMQAAGLSAAQRTELIDYLVGRGVADDTWLAKMMCMGPRKRPKLDVAPTVAGFGFEKHNHRHLSATQAGLKTADFPTWSTRVFAPIHLFPTRRAKIRIRCRACTQ